MFLITNLIFGKKEVPVEKPKVTKETLTISDDDVVSNYRMLTYGAGGKRDRKFLVGIDIDSNSFGNAEKYYFALQFAVLIDFTETDKTDEKGFKIYTLPESSMDIYMQRFFGPDVNYNKEGEISNTFRFRVDGKDTGILRYNSSNAVYDVSFSELREATKSDSFVDDCYYLLDEAYSYSDGRLVLVEKVVYTKLVENNKGTNDLYLYSDYNRQNTIGTINDITKDTVAVVNNTEESSANKYANIPTVFNIDEYKDKAGTITYNLKQDKYGYYFVNSEVKN